MKVFVDDTERSWFLALLADVIEEFAFECWNYCVMPNHYHLTVRPSLDNLPGAEEREQQRFAEYVLAATDDEDLIRDIRSNRSIVGDPTFVEAFRTSRHERRHSGNQ